ncbi:hypothetical protein [Cytobacillus sp. FSL R5-0596]|nr:hypothetical protein [Cytobacillus firmus]
MTHVFWGHSNDNITQEGLAIFMHDSYSDKKVFPNFQGDIDDITNYLLTQEVFLPLEVLMQNDQIFSTQLQT